MNISGWGNFPVIKSNILTYNSNSELREIIDTHNELIPFGNGRSYGDSALNKNIICTKPSNLFLNFDESKGLLHLQAGVLLSEILDVFVPKGWFLKITPGTKLITVGGAIASDVHGKNHHIDGCFSECVEMFTLMLANGDIIECSREKNVLLFHATCGGMGLTGVILDAKLYLKKINSKYINQTTIKTSNLKETFNAFEEYKDKTYSVAWIDCLASEKYLGKSLLRVGDFSDKNNLNYQLKKEKGIPFTFPSFIINKYSIKAFNQLYYSKVRQKISEQMVDIDTFFYPLDFIDNWNRIYGKNGFIQYQFILPKTRSYDGLHDILDRINNSGKGSFLAVLKLYGPANKNFLSFPLEGYSLALDFKIEEGLFELLDELDKIVIKYDGRIYLTKDCRVNKEVFEKGYPQVNKFRELRNKFKLNKKFNSLQSRRLEI